MKLILLNIIALFTSAAQAETCYKNPYAVLADTRFAQIHPLLQNQEYVGNIGSTFAARKDHDTYFNWEVNDQFFGRVYNTTNYIGVEDHFILCLSEGKFEMRSEEFNLGINVNEEIISVTYQDIVLSLTAYPLQSHGTLKNKLRNSEFEIEVKSPKPLKRQITVND